jgi:WD40 repeat protein
LAASSDRINGEIIRVWDVPGAVLRHTLKGHGFAITCLAVTPDGRFALSGSEDQRLILWDLALGAAIHTLQGHQNSVRAAAITPDGRCAISGGQDQSVRIWDLQTGQERLALTGQQEPRAVAITGDGRLAVSAGVSQDQPGEFFVRAWNLENGAALFTGYGHTGAVTALAISRDGQFAASASADHSLRVWSLKDGQQISAFIGDGPFTTCQFSTDGKILFVIDQEGQVHSLILENGTGG